MSDKSKKIKYCKCGHSLDPDHKKQVNFLGLKFKNQSKCNKCCCTIFIRRSFPNKLDKLSFGLLFGMVVFIIGTFTFLAYTSNVTYQQLLVKDPTHVLTTKYITGDTVFKLVPVFFVLLVMWFVAQLLGFYSQYRFSKNKETKPTDEDKPEDQK